MRNRKNRGIAKIKENANTAENVKIAENREFRKSWKLQNFQSRGLETTEIAKNAKTEENMTTAENVNFSAIAENANISENPKTDKLQK